MRAKVRSSAPAKTVNLGDLSIDFATGRLAWSDREFGFTPLSPVAQELIVAGGAEALIQKRLAALKPT